MGNLRLAPTIVSPEPEDSGARVVTASIPGFGDVDIVFSEAEAINLVRIFQQGFLERMGKRVIHPNYPHLSIHDVDLAHGATGTSLLFQTEEIGSMAVSFEPSLAAKLKAEIDRASDANLARRGKN